MHRQERIEALVTAMTLDEKIGQLTMSSAPDIVTGPLAEADLAHEVREGAVGSLLNLVGRDAIRSMQDVAVRESRLGIPLLFGLDVVHGYRTVLPVPLGECAAMNPELWEATARFAAREASAEGIDVTFAPMIDVCRDPRWGRVVECPGEDPWLASLYARAKVRGFQGAGASPGADALGATAKHLGGYGAVMAGLDYGPADVSARAMAEVYLPSFRAAVEAGVAAVMPSFIDLSGVPATANRALLTETLRGAWGFEGAIISDYGAVAELIPHGVAADLTEAAALALNAGVDIDMMGGAYRAGLPGAIARGLVTMDAVDAAVRRVLRLKARLGLLDDPWIRLAGASPSSAPDPATALSAAVLSPVLLKNGGLLPLSPEGGPVVLAGPLAGTSPEPIGPWTGLRQFAGPTGLAECLQPLLAGREVKLVAGDDPAAVAAAAGGTGTIVLCLGETYELSGEAASRAEPVLPAGQEDFARSVLALGRPVVVLLWSGRPLVATPILQAADAVLAAWLPCHGSGEAIAALLSGAEEPTGRLPLSWPASVGQIPVFFGHRPTGRPYAGGAPFTTRYLDAPLDPLYPFGHGLGYATIEVEAVSVLPAIAGPRDAITVTAAVRNTGGRDGAATLFLFIRDRVASIARPVLELRGLRRVALRAGTRGHEVFTLHPGDLAFPDHSLTPVLEPGEFDVFVGLSADPSRMAGTILRERSAGSA
jgi:beta-glucosidase